MEWFIFEKLIVNEDGTAKRAGKVVLRLEQAYRLKYPSLLVEGVQKDPIPCMEICFPNESVHVLPSPIGKEVWPSR